MDVTPGGDATKNARTVYRNLLSTPGWPSATPVVTDYERGTLNAYAAGIDPARVSASRNLIADIYGYWQNAEAGYFGPSANYNGTVFALLALGGARTQAGAQRVPQALVDKIVTRVRANQHNDGGWTYSKAEGNATELAKPGDIDMTGASMAALCVSGVPNTDPDIVQAKAFLKSKLINASGAFNAMYGINTSSNGWAVSGLNACGINPQTGDFLTPAGKTPVDFLIANQFNPAAWLQVPALGHHPVRLLLHRRPARRRRMAASPPRPPPRSRWAHRSGSRRPDSPPVRRRSWRSPWTTAPAP